VRENLKLLSSLAGRLIRLEKRIEPDVRAEVEKLSGGKTLSKCARSPRRHRSDKIEQHGGSSSRETAEFIQKSVAPIATNPDLRNKSSRYNAPPIKPSIPCRRQAFVRGAPTRKTTEAARDTIRSFRDYIEQHKARSKRSDPPFKKRLTEESLRELEIKLKPEFGPQPVPQSGTPSRKVERVLRTRWQYINHKRAGSADLVSLVRTAIESTIPLEPFEEHVRQRFTTWLEEKRAAGMMFEPDQLAWLEKMRDYISASGSVDREHLEADNVLARSTRSSVNNSGR